MIDYGAIRTRALREILAASSFSRPEDRKRISDLASLERMIASGAGNMIGATSLRQLRDRHPVETIRLTAEIREGRFLEQADAEREHAERRAIEDERRRLEQVEERGRRERREERERLAWIAAGGRP